MALDQKIVGRVYTSSRPFEVGREKIREFAEAIGDPNPVYTDAEAARSHGHPDVIAPPTFPIAIVWDTTGQVIGDPELGLALHRILHGEQRFAYARPIVAGDQLTCTLTIDAVKQAAGMDVISTRTDVATVAGEHVGTALATFFHRPEES